MKSFMFYLLSLTLLASCGKNNESGKSNNRYNNPYYSNQYGTMNSPYTYGGLGVNQVFSEHPCTTSGQPTQARVQVQLQVTLPNMNIIQPNDIYVGVTSAGDVGVLVGQGSSQALFVGYICQRGTQFTQASQPQLIVRNYGSQTRCKFKPLVDAQLALPIISPMGMPSYVPLNFRWLDGGSSLGQKFSFCI